MASNTDDSMGSPSMVSTVCVHKNHKAVLALVSMESQDSSYLATVRIQHGAEQPLCLGNVSIPRQEANIEQAGGAQLA